MRIVGLQMPGTPETYVGNWMPDTGRCSILATLEEFWRDCVAIAASRSADRNWVDIDDVVVVPPVLPGARIFCIGLNYRDHVKEGSYSDQPLPEFPTIFGKWSSSLTVSGTTVQVPPDEPGLDWEGEIAAWVGRESFCVGADEALNSVLGYSVFNDITARTAQKRTSQWTLGKNVDTASAVGPIVPAKEFGDLRRGVLLQTSVNGVIVQEASTSKMIFSVGDTLSLISRSIRLRPGDMLATGTPSGVGYARVPPRFLCAGDMVEVTAEGLGTVSTFIS